MSTVDQKPHCYFVRRYLCHSRTRKLHPLLPVAHSSHDEDNTRHFVIDPDFAPADLAVGDLVFLYGGGEEWIYHDNKYDECDQLKILSGHELGWVIVEMDHPATSEAYFGFRARMED